MLPRRVHHTLHSTGELARRTGTAVKTVRFYSDCGLVPPADRSPSGCRLYDNDAVARLDLVRALCDLGLDLAANRKVMDRELALSEVAAVHADALDVQIRILRLRRAVLTAVVSRGATPEETHLQSQLPYCRADPDYRTRHRNGLHTVTESAQPAARCRPCEQGDCH